MVSRGFGAYGRHHDCPYFILIRIIMGISFEIFTIFIRLLIFLLSLSRVAYHGGGGGFLDNDAVSRNRIRESLDFPLK